ncbi:MAG: hypothetical protein KDD44_15335, partial [Bdellovibrionales bacterium]|nr:hypothetical protein [Bdellovibrionales bacterium]
YSYYAAGTPMFTDQNGEITFTINIPNNPGLIGQHLTWQAVMIDSQNRIVSPNPVSFQIHAP